MLLTLNDLCLDHICNNLNLQEHLVLADVCEELENYIANRFLTAQNVIRNVERKSPNQNCMFETMPENCPKILRNLKYNNSGEIRCEASKLLRLKDAMLTLRFLDINCLKVHGSELKTMEQMEVFEEFVTSLFPNLEKFQSSINFSGKYIVKLKRLIELEVNNSNINENFIKCFERVKLKRLSFVKPLDNWQNLAKIEIFGRLEELTISEQDYKKLSELSDFKLPERLTKLVINAATDETEMKLDKSLACYAHISSVNFRADITLQEFSYENIKNIVAELQRLALAGDDIDTLKELYKTWPRDWKQIERTFYFNEERNVHDKTLEDKMLEKVRPIFGDNDFLGLNPKQRVAIVLLSQTRPKRFFVRYRNILSEYGDVN